MSGFTLIRTGREAIITLLEVGTGTGPQALDIAHRGVTEVPFVLPAEVRGGFVAHANVMMATVAGLIAVAVANKEMIAHPHGHTSVALCLLLFGGPILFLSAQGWYLWAVPHVSPRVQMVGSMALVLAGCAALMIPPFIALALAGMSLAIVVIIDWRHQTDSNAAGLTQR